MSKKDDEKKQEYAHQGSVAAEDAELTLWLNRLWARNEPPERLEVWQVFGKNRDARGEMIHHEDFPAGKKYDIEQANKLANEIMSAAQHDCDSTPKRREAYFQIAIIDRNRRATPLVRRIGPLTPKRIYAVARPGANDEGDDDEDDIDIKNIELRRIKHSSDEVRWDKTRNDRVLGDVLLLMRDLLLEERGRTQQLMSSQMEFFNRLQEAEDRKVQRELLVQREQFKFEIAKDGWRTVRNILPGLFAKDGAPAQTQQSNGNGNGGAKNYGTSPERTLVDNFLTDCEEKNLVDALFGVYDERDGKVVQTKEGIFSVKQFYILVGVRDGRLHPDVLDNLMPNSGHELAITQEQIEKAGAAGVSEGIGMAIIELVGLRQRAREAREATAQQQPPQNSTPVETTPAP